MQQILTVIFSISIFGCLRSNPLNSECLELIRGSVMLQMNQLNETFRKAQTTLDSAAGSLDTKFQLYKTLCNETTNQSFITTREINALISPCVDEQGVQDLAEKSLINNRFSKYECGVTETQYKAQTDPKILKKLNAKASKIERCFESNVKDNEENLNSFCHYDFKLALNCTHKKFKNDAVKLAGLEAFIGFWSQEINCASRTNTAITEFYNSKVGANKHQSFFPGFLKYLERFTKFSV